MQGEILKRERVVERGLAIYSSPQIRMQETSKIALDICGGTHIPDPRLVEATQGDWEGLQIDEIAARWPEVYKKRTGDIRWYFENPTGEALESVWWQGDGFPEFTHWTKRDSYLWNYLAYSARHLVRAGFGRRSKLTWRAGLGSSSTRWATRNA